ncbi:MAG: helix-hairpin-helix domain-containing protein [Bacteroidota bacterium]|nr:helix-hairpin-helix domain-containing protein [Bacteroidota bacterium]MDX5430073.1 helix-hairpin-helix domain-containing protein [Bacteroidota bacterium]MDX5468837.1 helix-hairpin-helix domain-containing protein [Bacteroidota bacterium]
MTGRNYLFGLGVLFAMGGQGQSTHELDFPVNNEEVIDPYVLQLRSEWRAHPLHLNTCTKTELLQIPEISETLAEAILLHRDRSGAFQSLLELQVIPGMSPALYQILIQYMTVESLVKGNANRQGEWRLKLRQKQSWLKEAAKQDYYTRMPQLETQWRWKGKGWKMGLRSGQDMGERLAWNAKQKGIDFYGGFVQVDRGALQVYAGDFRVRFGQGLLMGNSNSFGSLLWAASGFQSAGIQTYLGSDEQYFLRGLATTYQQKRWKLSAFCSDRKLDGHLNGVAFSTSGFHRDDRENDRRKRHHQRIAGFSLSRQVYRAQLGWNALWTSSGWTTSVDWRIPLRQHFVYGELSFQERKMNALTGGVFRLKGGVELGVLLYRYSRLNLTPFSGAYALFSLAQAQEGYSLRMSFPKALGMTWNMSLESARNRFSESGPPITKSKAFLEGSRRIHQWVFTLRWNVYQSTSYDAGESEPYKQSHPLIRQSLRIQFERKFEEWTWKTRWEQTRVNESETKTGFLLFQEIAWHPLRRGFGVKLRYSRYHAQGYEARIYAYVPELPYSFSIPSYSGSGDELILLLRFSSRDRGNLWIRGALDRENREAEFGAYRKLKPIYSWDLGLMYTYRF